MNKAAKKEENDERAVRPAGNDSSFHYIYLPVQLSAHYGMGLCLL